MDLAAGPIAGTLLIRVRMKEEARPKSPLRAERMIPETGRSERIVPVAWDADVTRAKAEVENGLLKVTVPKQKVGEKRPPGPETR